MAECIERDAAVMKIREWFWSAPGVHPKLDRDAAEEIMFAIPAADVVARDCYDIILAENDDMRAIIDTYGGLENIQSAFVKLHEIETADVVPVVRCGKCKHFNDDDGDCRCVKDAEWDEETATWYGFVSYHMPDFFCADGERKDGDANVQNWEKNHLRPTNMSGTKCEPCKPTQPECGDCEYIKDGDGDA